MQMANVYYIIICESIISSSFNVASAPSGAWAIFSVRIWIIGKTQSIFMWNIVT